MPTNDRDNINRNEGNLSSSFDNFSNALSRNSERLGENSDSLDTNTSAVLKLVESFNRTASKLGEDLEDFTEKTKRNFDNQVDSEQQLTTDASQMFERSKKNNEQALTRTQKLGSIFLTTVQVIGKRFLTELDKSMQRVAESYRQNFTDVTVRMQWSQSDYSDMWNSMAQTFLQEGLGRQFSSVDYVESLSEVLSTGLRGDEAQRQAYQNLITNQLIPAISTNTRSYRQMSKQFGDTFTEGITAIGKYSEDLYGAEGLEEGKLNNIIELYDARLRAEVASGNITEDQAQDLLNRTVNTFNALEQQGINTDFLVSTLNEVLIGTPGEISDISMYLTGAASSEGLMSQLINNPDELFEGILNRVYSNSIDSNRVGLTALGGGLDATTFALEVSAAINRGLDLDSIAESYEKFNANEVYQAQFDWLSAGGGKSADDQLSTFEENVTTPLGVIEGEIPRFRDLASDVKKILGAVVTIGILTKTKDLLGDTGDGLLNTLINKVTGKSATGGTGGRLLDKTTGTKLSGVSGALKLGGLAIGTGMLLTDASEGFTNSVAEGDSTATAVGKGILSGVTGVTETPDSMEEIGSGVLSNAAKGAGIGGIFGIGGALIGGLVGGIASLTHSLILYNSESAKQERRLEAATEQITNMNTALENLDTVSQETIIAEQALEVLRDDSTKGTDKYSTALKSLQKIFPDYISNTNEDADITEKQIDQLEYLIQLKEDQAYYESLEALGEVNTKNLGEAYKTEVEINAKASEEREAKNELDTAIREYGEVLREAGVASIKTNALGGVFYYDNEGNRITGDSLDKIKENYKNVKSNIKEVGEYDSDFDTMYTQDIIQSSGYLTGISSALGSGNTYEFDYSGNILGTEAQQSTEAYQDNTNAFDKFALSISSSIARLEENPKDATALSGLSQGVIQMNNLAEDSVVLYGMYTEDEFRDLIKDRLGSSLQDIIDEYDLSITSNYRVGAYSISSDDTLANLHQGEMVLTSTNADMLRNLGSGGISSLLTSLTAVSSAKVSATESTSNYESVSSVIVTAIQSQTPSIVSVLNNIYTSLEYIRGNRNVPTTTSTVPESVLNFTGVT